MDVFIGKKNLDTYIRALEQENEVSVLARGVHIKKAVDVALISTRLGGYEITETLLYDEEMQSEENTNFYVSAIKITLNKVQAE
ncbi:MAG: hypothetical protein KAX49_03890 [Halanaerobiales bacterium]|nr:hypothetical protein [Halanaerobiales bacterium]